MILLEQQSVSLELVKRLKELGVKQESVWGWMQESVSKQYWLGLSDDKKTFEVASAFTVSKQGGDVAGVLHHRTSFKMSSWTFPIRTTRHQKNVAA